MISLGGATEAAIWSIAYPIGEVDPAWRPIPYGRPLPNQTFHVLDDRLAGVPGAGCRASCTSAASGWPQGYWRDEERTAASFVTHPVTGERLYRTGDLGRWLPDGDHRVPRPRGLPGQGPRLPHRAGRDRGGVLAGDAVDAAVAAAVGEDRHHRRIAAYLVPAVSGQDEEALLTEVRALLEQRLPGYMMPASFVVLDRLPLTGNGKVDRAALPQPGAERDLGGAAGSDADPELVARLAAIVAEVIGVEQVGPRETSSPSAATRSRASRSSPARTPRGSS